MARSPAAAVALATMPAGRRVLVTRPEPGASATAARLARAGFVPLTLPLSRVAGVDAGPSEGRFAAVAATSANAVRFAGGGLLGGLRDKPFFAVGTRTAEAALHAGFVEVREGEGDAAALARLVPAAGGRVAYLCGRVRRPDFETALRARGVEAVPFETYDTLAHAPSREAIMLLGPAPVDAVLLFSAMGAEAYARLAERREAAGILKHAQAFALSPRIAAALPPAVPCRVASRPEEDALLVALEDWARG